jgi:2-polyprenyl-3-methyl-5-hydroxy-6-metoxy-1,4-benzoquinol methylase
MSKGTLERAISDAHYSDESEYERSNKGYMRALVPTKALRILDIGCGTGLNAAHLTRAGHTVVGIDLSPVAIERFRGRGLEGLVCDIEAEPLPFEDGSFDLAYASEVIEHCADTDRFVGELARVIKPRGLLLLSTPNSAFWAYRLLALFGQTVTEIQHPGHVRFFSKRGLKHSIEAGGFEVNAISGREMYVILGKQLGDGLGPLLERLGFEKEPRFATGGHFWQLSRFAQKASPFWADTLIVSARKVRDDRQPADLNMLSAAAETKCAAAIDAIS